MDDKEDETYYALKYPDYHNWRDRKTIRNGYWSNGEQVYTTDPEFRPYIDKLTDRLVTDKEYRDLFLKNILGID